MQHIKNKTKNSRHRLAGYFYFAHAAPEAPLEQLCCYPHQKAKMYIFLDQEHSPPHHTCPAQMSLSGIHHSLLT